MFLVCDEIAHLHRLHFSWLYDQAFHTLGTFCLGGTFCLLQREALINTLPFMIDAYCLEII